MQKYRFICSFSKERENKHTTTKSKRRCIFPIVIRAKKGKYEKERSNKPNNDCGINGTGSIWKLKVNISNNISENYFEKKEEVSNDICLTIKCKDQYCIEFIHEYNTE